MIAKETNNNLEQNNINILQVQNLTAENFFQVIEKLQISINEIKKTLEVPTTKLLSREETAKLLGITKTTLDCWTKLGILHCNKMGHRVYYVKDEVIKTVEKNKKGGRE
jgi:hypothetical protein